MKARRTMLLTALLVGAVSALCFTNLAQDRSTCIQRERHGLRRRRTEPHGLELVECLRRPLAEQRRRNGCLRRRQRHRGHGSRERQRDGQCLDLQRREVLGNYTLSSGTITLACANPAITTNADATISASMLVEGGPNNTVYKFGTGTLTLTGPNDID